MKIPALFTSTVLCTLSACSHTPSTDPGASKESELTAESGKAFVERTNDELREIWVEAGRAEWVKSTYITDDTEALAAKANERSLSYMSKLIPEVVRYDNVQVDADTRRQLMRLKNSRTLPAPNDAASRKELAQIMAKMEGIYGKGKFCRDPKDCQDLGALMKIMAEERNYDKLLEAWKGWRTISPPMRDMYQRFVDIANYGAKDSGFSNVSALWKAGYEMDPDAFEGEIERLWNQVKPLYEQLHCDVRAQLSKHYGADKVEPQGLIPAHLLGNMWAQEWGNIYPLVAPYKGESDIDVTKALKRAKYDARKMVKTAEGFFTSMGLTQLPETFWQRSMFTKPADREVVCHASAWDVTLNNDLRIKMCIEINEEDFVTIHHELGHNYYYTYYYNLPPIYQDGAHDGFHEAIGDAVALSMTPKYLKQIGVLNKVADNNKSLINQQMKVALDKIGFLPFGKLVDQWRWDVFSGKTQPADYNKSWWALREKYQGIKAPVVRTEADFDPGAKYHVPANVPYIRYFLARILQFQFHKAMCEAAGHDGPLHTCSIYGSEAAGTKLREMMSLGASRPWPEALEVMTGTRQMSAEPLVEYFAPLMEYLQKQNEGRQCGW